MSGTPQAATAGPGPNGQIILEPAERARIFLTIYRLGIYNTIRDRVKDLMKEIPIHN